MTVLKSLLLRLFRLLSHSEEPVSTTQTFFLLTQILVQINNSQSKRLAFHQNQIIFIPFYFLNYLIVHCTLHICHIPPNHLLKYYHLSRTRPKKPTSSLPNAPESLRAISRRRVCMNRIVASFSIWFVTLPNAHLWYHLLDE